MRILASWTMMPHLMPAEPTERDLGHADAAAETAAPVAAARHDRRAFAIFASDFAVDF